MGQVVTLMPLLQQTIVVEQNAEFMNQVGGKQQESVTPVPFSQKKPSGVVQGATQMPTLPTKPKPTSGGINIGSGGTSIGVQPSGSPPPPPSNVPTDFGFNIPNWSALSCSEVASEVTRLTNIRMQKVNRPAEANALLDTNIAFGNSILQNECQPQTAPSGGGGISETGGFGGGDFGVGDFGGFGESGFGTSGFGESGDFQQPSAEGYEVLAYDKLGCPIYGYDEKGTPLYGVDQNGNIITDPTVLPCGMKAMAARIDESPIKQISSDITFRASLLALGGIAAIILIAKK